MNLWITHVRKSSARGKWHIMSVIGLAALLVSVFPVNSATAGPSESVVGIESWPLFQDDALHKEKANLPGGTEVSVVRSSNDGIDVQVRTAGGESGFVHRFALCAPSEFQRRKAHGEIPHSIVKVVYENGGFCVTPVTGYVDISIGGGAPRVQAGQAYWIDNSTQGKTFHIASTEVQANHLYLVRADGSVTELPIWSEAIPGTTTTGENDADGIGLILTLVVPALSIITVLAMLIVWHRRERKGQSRIPTIATFGLDMPPRPRREAADLRGGPDQIADAGHIGLVFSRREASRKLPWWTVPSCIAGIVIVGIAVLVISWNSNPAERDSAEPLVKQSQDEKLPSSAAAKATTMHDTTKDAAAKPSPATNAGQRRTTPRTGPKPDKASTTPAASVDREPKRQVTQERRYQDKPVEHWKAALRDGDGATREQAAEALTEYGAAAVPALCELLRREKEGVHLDVALRPREIEARILYWNENTVQEAAARVLRKIAPATIPAITKLLRDPDARIRVVAVQALSEVRPTPAIVQGFVELLCDKDERVRLAAVEALGKMGTEAAAAVPALTECLQDDVGLVRVLATQSLGKIGSAAKPAIPALVTLLKHTGSDDSVFAAQALQKMGKQAVPAVTELLRDKDKQVQETAARLLRELGVDAKTRNAAAVRDVDSPTGPTHLERFQDNPHIYHYHAIAFTPDGKQLAGFWWENREATVRLWDLNLRETRLLRLSVPTNDLADNPGPCGFAFSNDGKIVAACLPEQGLSANAVLYLWDVETGKRLRTSILPGQTSQYIRAAAVSPGVKAVAIARQPQDHPSSFLELWDTEPRELKRKINLGENWLTGLYYSSDGKHLLLLYSNDIELRAADSGQIEYRFAAADIRRNSSETVPITDKGIATKVKMKTSYGFDWGHGAIAPDGKTLALVFSAIQSGGGYSRTFGVMVLFNVETRAVFEGEVYNHPPSQIVFSPDGQILALEESGLTLKKVVPAASP